MPKVLKIKKQQGQKARILLLEKNWLDKDRIIGRTQRYLLFPLIEAAEHKQLLKLFKNATIENRNLERIKKKVVDFWKNMHTLVPKKYQKLLRRSFDIIGDIAIVEVPKELVKLEKSFAWSLRKTHPNVKVVAKKTGPTKGKYRIRKVQVIGGEERTETIHLEHGVKMKVDINKTYFSPRLSGDRLKIANQVKPFEKVLVMFAGIGPYPLVIAKKQPTADIWAVELNPSAVKLMKYNVKLNKFEKRIRVIKGDVRKEVPKLKTKFDRIVMMLPTGAREYLDIAYKVAKKNATLHVYGFAGDEEIPAKVSSDIDKELKKIKKNGKLITIKKCGTYAPHVWRICAEIKVL